MTLFRLRLLPLLAVTANGQNSVLFGPIVSQDPFPACNISLICNGQFCADVCVDGSVAVDPWIQATIAFQRDLQADRALYGFQWLGLHNAFISRTNGMGLSADFGAALFTRTLSTQNSTLRVADQIYGITDLLNMGARHLEADIWSTDVVTGAAHICHSPVMDPLYGIALQESADALGMGLLDYDGSRELCSNMSFAAAMSQVQSWLQQPTHAREVVIIYLDNRVPVYNIDSVVNDLKTVFGSSLLTPLDLATTFHTQWPSLNQMILHNKRVIVESNSYDPNNYTGTNLTSVAFYPTLWEQGLGQFSPADLIPAPNCTIAGSSDWYGQQWVRVYDGAVTWYPDYDERTSGGIHNRPAGIVDMLACAVGNVGISNFGPDVLPGLAWSWAGGEPRVPTSGNCTAAAMTSVRGRWTAQPCDSAFPATCRFGNSSTPSGNNPSAWALTPPVTFPAAGAACAQMGAGWAFDLPRDGRENYVISSNASLTSLWRTSPGIWLNYAI